MRDCGGRGAFGVPNGLFPGRDCGGRDCGGRGALGVEAIFGVEGIFVGRAGGVGGS